MSLIKVVEGDKYTIVGVSLCEGCHFYKPHLDEECSFPEEIELNCGPDTVYKKLNDKVEIE
jgi:hypothetical protein